MAEFGIASGAFGIVSVAAQIADGVIKLKRFCDEVKGAPEELAYLLEEADAFETLLKEMTTSVENTNNQILQSSSVNTHIQRCEKAAKDWYAVITTLETDLKKNKLRGSLKLTLRKDTLTKLQGRLKDRKDTFMISYGFYKEALDKYRHDSAVSIQREDHREIISRFEVQYTQIEALQNFLVANYINVAPNSTRIVPRTPSNTTITRASSYDVSDEYDTKSLAGPNNKPRRARPDRQFKARFQMPRLLHLISRGGWDFSACRWGTSWQFTFRSYNIVPSNASVIELACEGDIKGLQKLFQEGRGTPFDLCSEGTVLTHAAVHLQYETCKFLIQQGANPNIIEDYYKTKSAHRGRKTYGSTISSNIGPYGEPYRQMQAHDVLQILIANLDANHFVDCIDDFNGTEVFHKSLVTWLVNETYPPLYTRDSKDRLKLTMRLLHQEGAIDRKFPTCVRNLLHGIPIYEVAHYKHYFQPLSRSDCSDFLTLAVTNLASQFSLDQWDPWFIDGPQLVLVDGSGRIELVYGNEPEDCYEALEVRKLLEFIRELLTAGAQLVHQPFCMRHRSGRDSPLKNLIYGLFGMSNWPQPRDIPQRPHNRNVLDPLGMWLCQLELAGIDLEQYGRWEKAYFRRTHGWGFTNNPGVRLADCRYFKGHLVDFTYGPSRDDWDFWFSWIEIGYPQHGEALAEFWDMVDHPERAMPGSWNF